MFYNVYRVSSLGAPRNHHAIFIETRDEGDGELAQVTGNIQEGMTFEYKETERPETSYDFVDKDFIGIVSIADLPRIEQVCRAVEPPKKQFQVARRLYPSERLRRCQEWTKEATDKLFSEGVLKK